MKVERSLTSCSRIITRCEPISSKQSNCIGNELGTDAEAHQNMWGTVNGATNSESTFSRFKESGVTLLFSFACDFAVLHFALFCDRIFELQLLAQFLMDFPKICTVHLTICNLHG